MTRRLLDNLWVRHKTNTLPAAGSVTGQLAADMAQLPPEERAKALAVIRDGQLARSGFHEPFKPTKTLDDVARHHGIGALNAETREFAERIFASLEHEEVTHRVTQQLGGSDADHHVMTEPDRREQVAAAFDALTGDQS